MTKQTNNLPTDRPSVKHTPGPLDIMQAELDQVNAINTSLVEALKTLLPYAERYRDRGVYNDITGEDEEWQSDELSDAIAKAIKLILQAGQV